MATIRPAEAEDIEALVALTEEMDRFYGATDIEPEPARHEQLHAALFADPPSAYVLVACDQNTSIVAFAAYSFLWPAVGLTRSLYLKELYVAQRAQRSGIGSELMHALIALASEESCSRIEWTTDVDNTVARTFYESLGLEQADKLFFRLAISPAANTPSSHHSARSDRYAASGGLED